MPEKLTLVDRSALLDTAIFAWSHTTSRPEKLRFVWREKAFASTIDDVTITVETIDGRPVAARHYY